MKEQVRRFVFFLNQHNGCLLPWDWTKSVHDVIVGGTAISDGWIRLYIYTRYSGLQVLDNCETCTNGPQRADDGTLVLPVQVPGTCGIGTTKSWVPRSRRMNTNAYSSRHYRPLDRKSQSEC